MDAAEVPADHRIDRAAIGAVADVDGDLADLVHAGACLAQQRRQIGQREIGLCRGVLGPASGSRHEAAVQRRAGLAAHEQLGLAGGHHRALPGDVLAEPVLHLEGPQALHRRADHRLGVDLHHQFRQRQAGDQQAGADREHVAQPAADRLVHRLAVRAIDQRGGQLGDVAQRSAGRLQCRLDVVERGMGLRRGIAESGDRTIGLQCAPSAQKHARTAANSAGDGHRIGRCGVEWQQAWVRHSDSPHPSVPDPSSQARRVPIVGDGGRRHVQLTSQPNHLEIGSDSVAHRNPCRCEFHPPGGGPALDETGIRHATQAGHPSTCSRDARGTVCSGFPVRSAASSEPGQVCAR